MKLIIMLALAVVLLSCSESSTSSNTGGIRVKSTIAKTTVQSFSSKNSDIAAQDIDSIKIVNIRYLISDILLIPSGSSSGRAIKAGPFILGGGASGINGILTESELANGAYNKVKFEFHRLSESESLKYEADTLLKDFATSSRYSTIIEGTIYYSNGSTNFIFNSQQVANLSLDLLEPININNNYQDLLLEIDPEIIFKKNGQFLDPLDGKNENDIENNLKSAIKAAKINS